MCVPVHVCACACAGVYMCISAHKICGNCMLDTDGTCVACAGVYIIHYYVYVHVHT